MCLIVTRVLLCPSYISNPWRAEPDLQSFLTRLEGRQQVFIASLLHTLQAFYMHLILIYMGTNFLVPILG